MYYTLLQMCRLLSRPRQPTHDDQTYKLLEVSQHSAIGVSYVAVEDDGTVTLNHKRL